MKIAITGATGFLGRAIGEHLRGRGHAITAVSLRQELKPDLFLPCDAVINLAGEPIAQRWTKAARQRIRDSRILGTRALVEALRAAPPSVLVSASAIGYYGSRGNNILTEDATAGSDFLGKLAVRWEREALAAQTFGVRVVTPRIGVVLGPGGGALKKMLPPFRLGIGGRLGNGKQWMSWIHIEDLAALIEFAITNPDLDGPVNAAAPAPVTNAEFTRTLARALHRPAIFPVPEFILKLIFGEMSQVLLGSQRVLPEAALRAGFDFRYSDLGLALAAALGSHNTSATPKV
jgi:uncharacterized protein (TIGR01777 family)